MDTSLSDAKVSRPSVWLVTVGLGGKRWSMAASRLGRQAIASGLFSKVIVLNESSLEDKVPSLFTLHSEFILENQRGFGYWLWKPFIISQMLSNELPEGHVLIYLDAGCELNLTPKSVDRFYEYLDLVQTSGLVAFKLEDSLADWCKSDLLLRCGLAEHAQNIDVVQAGIIMLSKTLDNEKLIEDWKELAVDENFHFLDDSQSLQPNSKNFIEHRHDQAIWTCLLAARGYSGLPNETAVEIGWSRQQNHYPIWALRNSSNFAITSSSLNRFFAVCSLEMSRLSMGVSRRMSTYLRKFTK